MLNIIKKNKESLQEKGPARYQDLSAEEGNEKQEYSC